MADLRMCGGLWNGWQRRRIDEAEVDAEKLIAHLSKRRGELAAEIRSLRAEQEHIEAFIDMFGLGIPESNG